MNTINRDTQIHINRKPVKIPNYFRSIEKREIILTPSNESFKESEQEATMKEQLLKTLL